jgi:hypothetical protein
LVLSLTAAAFLGAVAAPDGARAMAVTLGAGAPAPQTEWPSYGADLANSRTVAGGPAVASVPSLVQAWRDDFSDGGVVYSLVSSGFLGAWSERTGVPLAQISLAKPGSITPAVSFGGVSVADGLVVANAGSQGSSGSIVAFRAPAT